MKLSDILELTGATKKTIYRWMNKHPESTVAEPGAALGRPFPRPVRKVGREVEWDRDEVLAWWHANEHTVGRHPETEIEMSWEAFRNAMLVKPVPSEDVDGRSQVRDDMDMVSGFRRVGERVRIRFRSASDAILFKLKY